MEFLSFLQHLTNALSLGSLYALIAIGYTMVYGILRLINFAHGDVFMLGGYIAFYCIVQFFMPWWVGFIVAFGITCIFGIFLERVAYRPLRQSPKISLMISAIGASFLIQNLATVIFGGRPKDFNVAPVFSQIITVGSVSVVTISLIIPILTAIILAVLTYIITKTKDSRVKPYSSQRSVILVTTSFAQNNAKDNPKSFFIFCF